MKKLKTYIFISLTISLCLNFIELNANPDKERDLFCISLLEIASEKSKKADESLKYKKLKKLQKKFLIKYPENYFSEDDFKLINAKHSSKIKEKSNRYINKGLQKCGLK